VLSELLPLTLSETLKSENIEEKVPPKDKNRRRRPDDARCALRRRELMDELAGDLTGRNLFSHAGTRFYAGQ
jgi:hypothetical protein